MCNYLNIPDKKFICNFCGDHLSGFKNILATLDRCSNKTFYCCDQCMLDSINPDTSCAICHDNPVQIYLYVGISNNLECKYWKASCILCAIIHSRICHKTPKQLSVNPIPYYLEIKKCLICNNFENIRRCKRCKLAHYCSDKCLRKDIDHKIFCHV